jgi:hypothetical protein
MKNDTLKYGLLGAAAVSFYLLLLYFVDKKLLTQSGIAYWLPFVLHAAIMWKATQDDMTKHGTARDFRALTRTPFGVFALANLGFWVCMYALHLADPAITHLELAAQLQGIKAQLAQNLEPQTRYELTQTAASIERDLASGQPLPQPLSQYLMPLAMWNLFGFGLTAAIVAILKNKN